VITDYYFFKITVFSVCVFLWLVFLFVFVKTLCNNFNFKNIMLGRFYKLKYEFFEHDLQFVRYFLLKSEADTEYERNQKNIKGSINFLSCFRNYEDQIKYVWRS
jgi:hypothetical protein